MTEEKRKTMSIPEAIIGISYIQEALLTVLISKGIIKPEEIQKAIETLKKSGSENIPTLH